MSLVPASAQTPQAPLQCSIVRQQREEQTVQALLNQTTQKLQVGQTSQAVSSLQRALQVLQSVESPELKANSLRSITEIGNSDPPSGLLVETVTLAQKTGQAEAMLPLLAQAGRIAQSLPTGYTSAKITALVAIARHYTILGHSDQAAPALTLAQQAIPNLYGSDTQIKALTSVAQEYARFDQSAQALPLLDRAWAMAQQMRVENELQFTWMLQPIALTYAQLGSFDKAFAVAERISPDMFASFYHDDTIAQVAVLYAPDQRSQALDRIRQLKRLDIRARALMQVAKAEWDSGTTTPALDLLEEARALLPQIEDVGQQYGLASQLAETYLALGDSNTALAVAASIPEMRSRVLTQANVAAKSNKEDMQDVVSAIEADLQTLSDPSQQNAMRQEVIDKFVVAKRYATAIQLVRAVPESDLFSVKPEWLSWIVREAVATGDLGMAEQAAEEIPESWIDYRNRSWQAIAQAYAKAGEEIRAAVAVGNINNYGSLSYQVRTIAQNSEIYRNLGRTELSQYSLERALEITRGFDTDLQLTDGLVAIAIQHAKLGNSEQAAALRTEALQIAAKTTDTGSHDYLLRGMVQQFLDAQQYEAALEVAKQYRPGSGERDQTYYQIVDAMIQAEQLAQARQATTTVPLPQVRTRLLLTIADRYLQQGQAQLATETLDQAFATAKTIPDPESRMLSVREDLQVEDSEDRGSLLSDIAWRYSQAGNAAQARTVAATIQSQGIRDPLIQQINCLD
ncbi:MAG TPA: hypothetical protein V6D29_04560 [Leptolyngbyaceae cyanobacterium]